MLTDSVMSMMTTDIAIPCPMFSSENALRYIPMTTVCELSAPPVKIYTSSKVSKLLVSVSRN